MPVHAIYDLLADAPSPIDDPFALAARRITSAWLDAHEVVATPDDLRLASEFLRRVGLTVEALPTGRVRLVSQAGRETVVSRETAVMTAIRRLVTQDPQHPARDIGHAA